MTKKKKAVKTREQHLKAKVRSIESWLMTYQHSLRALLATLPPNVELQIPEIITVGYSEIWPCKNGVVILMYSKPNQLIEIYRKSNQLITINEFMRTGSPSFHYNENGELLHIWIEVQSEISQTVVHLARSEYTKNGNIYKAKYQHAIICGWNADLGEPDKEALRDFHAAYTLKNLGETDLALKSTKISSENASKLLNEYKVLLNNAKREEQLQEFLREHPEFLYPDYITCYPKFKLGEDFVTDYCLLVQGSQGPTYVFIEIERADKKIFTKSGQFHSDFTQAKNQLLDWDKWITKNHYYLSNKLEKFYKPSFHLIMGRMKDLEENSSDKIKTEFSSTSKSFSTYDNLADRFEQILQRLLPH